MDFQGRFYHAKGAVLEPKPVQKPYPPLLLGGFGPGLLRLAGRYAGICFIPPWLKMPQGKARMMVSQEARRAGRLNKLAFAAGSAVYREKFDLKAVEKDVEAAVENGSLYYVTPFPLETWTVCASSLRRYFPRTRGWTRARPSEPWQFRSKPPQIV